MQDHEKDREKDSVPEYEPPTVVDYGTLVEITHASTLNNADTPAGTPNTAFPLAS